MGPLIKFIGKLNFANTVVRCEHTWKIVEKRELDQQFGFWETSSCTRFIQHCGKCGAMKSNDFRQGDKRHLQHFELLSQNFDH